MGIIRDTKWLKVKPVDQILNAIGSDGGVVSIERFNGFMEQVAKLMPQGSDTGRFVGNFSPQNKKNIPVTELTDLLDAMMMIDRDRFICMHKTAVALNLNSAQAQ